MGQTIPPQQPTSRRFMTWMLKSPFHVFMGGLLLITVTGRKTGRLISTPVNYARVTLLLNGKTYRAAATVVEDRTAVEQQLLRFFRLTKRTIAGIHLDKNGQPTKPEKFAQVAQSRIIIELTHLTAQ
jgi:hypothetical protein